jgi:hypothetical protein
MMTRKLLAILALLCFSWAGCSSLLAQTATKCWVLFTHKVVDDGPITTLSPRSLERRQRQGIALDERDLPVDGGFILTLQDMGIQPLQCSRWLNGVSASLTPAQVAQVRALPFVREVRPIPQVQVQYEAPDLVADKNYSAGYSSAQIKMVNLHHLHSAGYYGQGVMICVMDNGFRNVEDNPYLSHLYRDGRVLATYDFVGNDGNPYDGGSHGAYVLSILAAYGYGVVEGSAPGATYVLCRTENDASEKHQEEDNWVAAMEFGDSLGADIFSTSLGYFNGMQDTIIIGGDTIVDYQYSHLDGNTAIITVAADIAASRGILVVNSAGNNGVLKLNAPADGDSVLAIGSVDSLGRYSNFSSQGNTADGRLKPDVTAMGSATTYIGTDYQIYKGSGTSFSCPVTSGMAACLLQASNSAGGMTLFDAIVRSADRYENPDSLYGHGIPNSLKAYQILTGKSLEGYDSEGEFSDNRLIAFPTFIDDYLYLGVNSLNEESTSFQFCFFDALGKRVLEGNATVGRFFQVVKLERSSYLKSLPAGSYTIRMWTDKEPDIVSATKIFIRN